MNYSKGIRKVTIARRVIISWLIVAVCFLVIGFTIGYCVKGSPKNKEAKIYGTYDEKNITTISLDWEGDLNFIPLNVSMDESLQEFIFYLSKENNIDFTFIMAVIQQESNFQSDALSATGDYGLMQINQINHNYITQTIGITDFLDPYQNAEAGIFILRQLFEKYEDVSAVLMAYNMGESAANRLWEHGIYETNYTRSILTIQRQFNGQLESK